MHRPEVTEETKPEQQMYHVFVGGIVQRCYYLIAQRNTAIAAQRLPQHFTFLYLFSVLRDIFPEKRMTNYFQALFQNLKQTPKVAKDLKSWQKPRV